MEKIGKHKLLSQPECMSASDSRPKFPLPMPPPPEAKHCFLVAMIILLQEALVVSALGLAAEYGK